MVSPCITGHWPGLYVEPMHWPMRGTHVLGQQCARPHMHLHLGGEIFFNIINNINKINLDGMDYYKSRDLFF